MHALSAVIRVSDLQAKGEETAVQDGRARSSGPSLDWYFLCEVCSRPLSTFVWPVLKIFFQATQCRSCRAESVSGPGCLDCRLSARCLCDARMSQEAMPLPSVMFGWVLFPTCLACLRPSFTLPAQAKEAMGPGKISASASHFWINCSTWVPWKGQLASSTA